MTDAVETYAVVSAEYRPSASAGRRQYDVAVVGAGPAGLAAAVAAAQGGLTVALIDSSAQPGGQFWRHPDSRMAVTQEDRGQHLWRRFVDLNDRLRSLVSARAEGGQIIPIFGRQVWFVEPGEPTVFDDPPRSALAGSPPFTVYLTTTVGAPAGPAAVTARTLILCPGGYDRQLPVPGWDLPGVMAAGGVQALLKAHRSVAGRRAVVAGTGPFLLPVAAGLAEAGAGVAAVCESADAVRGWSQNLREAAAMPSKALEGVEYAYALARRRIPYRTRTVVIEVLGTDRVTGVRTARLDRQGTLIPGSVKEVDADLVAFGWGFTPSLELITATGAGTRIDVDGSLVAQVDLLQRATVAGVYVAGEATGVGGAALALAEGELAGIVVAKDLGRRFVPQNQTRVLQAAVAKGRRFAGAMHRAHPVPEHWQDWLRPETTVCRCEEVTYGDLRTACDELGADDPRTAKLVARPGMGWCQGRVCGFATACITAPDGVPGVADLASIAKRTLAAPITLAELADGGDPPRPPRYDEDAVGGGTTASRAERGAG